MVPVQTFFNSSCEILPNKLGIAKKIVLFVYATSNTEKKKRGIRFYSQAIRRRLVFQLYEETEGIPQQICFHSPSIDDISFFYSSSAMEQEKNRKDINANTGVLIFQP